MLCEILRRLPNAVSFFSGNVCKTGAQLGDLFFVRLKLSHALAAVWSPGSAKKFDDESAAWCLLRKRKISFAICRGQCERGRGRTDTECFGLISHCALGCAVRDRTAASFIIASFQFHHGKNLFRCGLPDGEAFHFFISQTPTK